MSIMSDARSHRQAFEMGVMDEWVNKMPTGIMEGEYAQAYLSGYNLCDRWKSKVAFNHMMINMVGECFANGYVDGHTKKVCDQSAREAIFNEAVQSGYILGRSLRAMREHS